jgi:hypothetical protein
MQHGMYRFTYGYIYTFVCLFSVHFLRLDSPNGLGPPPFRIFETTFRHTTLGRTSLDE